MTDPRGGTDFVRPASGFAAPQVDMIPKVMDGGSRKIEDSQLSARTRGASAGRSGASRFVAAGLWLGGLASLSASAAQEGAPPPESKPLPAQEVGAQPAADKPRQETPPPAPAPIQDPAPNPADQPPAQKDTGNAQPQPGVPSGPATTPAAPALPAYAPRYRGASEAALWCDTLEQAAPESVRRFALATTRDGHVTPAVEIAAPGPLAPELRPTLLVIGALDGRSLAGAEAALGMAHAFAQQIEQLGPGVTVVVAPYANLEALDHCEREGRSDGLTTRPVDDDRDGALDEDGPDDLDDDGLVLEMLVEAPNGEWSLSDDLRWAVRAVRGAPGRRFVRVREGRDDDGDGRFNEDGAGGVDLDRNFPVGREGPWSDPSVGALPLSEPVSRALAEFARSRRCFAVLMLQGRHGGLATPGGTAELEGWSRADHNLYDRLAASLARFTNRAECRALPLRAARGGDAPGAALDWFAASCGALAVELAPWGPQVDARPASAAQPARFDAADADTNSRQLEATDRAWARWLDEVRSGMGYVSWRPIDLRTGVAAYVGGFEPWTVDTPPPESLGRALNGLSEFALALCADAPRLEFANVSAVRSAGVLRVRASVRNVGALPTGLRAPSAASAAEALRLELELGEGVQRLAGAASVRLEPLAGGALSREAEWIVLAPAATSVKLRAQGGWCATIEREVRE
jgi:hypothetical protein